MAHKTIPFADFDPNKLQAAGVVWGVYAGDSFKVYAKRSGALNRFAQWSLAKFYEFDPALGKWVEIAVKNKPAQPHVCSMCGMTTESYPRHYDYTKDMYVYDTTAPMRDHGHYGWERRNGKLIAPLTWHYACEECWEGPNVG